MTSDVRAAFEGALEDLRRQGVEIVDASLAGTQQIAETYVHLILPEAAAWHGSALDARAGDYTPAVRARLESGRAITAVQYLRARAARRTLRASVDAALANGDALVLPTLPIVAPLLGADEVTLDPGGVRLPVRAAMLRLTQPFNLTGHPAISLPVRAPGLPVGLQLVGAREQTTRLLALAAAVESLVSPEVAS
jgi:aspartyl-tRNA(Asn)/glutamyl-tRNA(Gln) amidotransferase subunit A